MRFLLFFVSFLPLSLMAQTDHIEVVQFNHIALHVKDIPTSAKFYGETLGLPPVEIPDSLKTIRAWFQLGNTHYGNIHFNGARHMDYRRKHSYSLLCKSHWIVT